MSDGTLWVIVQAFNAYDQHGDYFVAAFEDKPTVTQIQALGSGLATRDVADHLVSSGGGRRNSEYTWYLLHNVPVGGLYRGAPDE